MLGLSSLESLMANTPNTFRVLAIQQETSKSGSHDIMFVSKVIFIVISEDVPVYEALHQIGQRSCPIWCNVLYTGKCSDLSDLSLIPTFEIDQHIITL